MRRLLKELALAIGGVGLGTALFIVSSSHVYFEEMLYVSWGYPLPWHYAGDLITATPSPFGSNIGAITWGAFYIDLAFWLALPIAALELSSHLAVPYVMRLLKLRREKHSTTAISAYGFFETPK